jgi:solute carrier family 10 (sodium/bile acid cotransporter), member 7
MLQRHWFLIALPGVLFAGLGFGPQLAPTLDRIPRDVVVALVMLLPTLTIDLWGALAHRATWIAAGLASAINAGLAPLLAAGIAPFLTADLAAGLVVAATVPCTLASAAVWTRRGGGNEAVALLVTFVTNILSFLILPAWLVFLLGKSHPIAFGELSVHLLKVVVAPVLVAQALRKIPAALGLITKHRLLLSNAAQVGVLLMVLIGAVSAGAALRATGSGASFGLVLQVTLAALALHGALFAIGWFSSRAVGLAYPEQLATAIAGSQKTLAVGLDIALTFGGLAVLPMIAYHVLQLLLDTWLVERLRKNGSSSQA